MVHYSQLAADRIASAQQIVALHLPSLAGESCSGCGQLFPCAFRRAADGTLDAYGRLPCRVPGATLRAAGVNLAAIGRPADGRRDRDRNDRTDRGRVTAAAERAQWPVNCGRADAAQDDRMTSRSRGWFDAVINPAVGVAQVPLNPADENGRRPRFVPVQRPRS